MNPLNLRDDARAMSDDLVRLRRSLHRIPEVGLELPRTQEAVLAELDGLPLEVRTGEGISSVTAVLRGGQPGPTVLLRGDMDALPVAERTGLDFAADTDRMHACGHDLHTTMLTGAARLLAAHRERLAGDVLFMFQPGEEGFDGARHMLAEGLLNATGRRPDAAYAIHVMSAGLPSGVFGTRGGPVLAAANVLRVTVRGEGGHGSMPHRAKDPVQAACAMVGALQAWITRTFDIFDPVVLTVGTFHAGTQQNIIPETAVFEASVRSFSPQAQALVKDGTVEVCRGIATAFGVSVDADFAELYPVTVNDHAEAAFAADVVRDALGEERYGALPQPLPGSEDFSRVLDEIPGAMLTLGAPPAGADPERSPNNHSPLAEFDDAVLADGAAVYAELAARRLTGTDPKTGAGAGAA
ncbi:amidohydrolase [Streptomyces kasugaensis]|uniref:Amidohydrolase n=1 Tax=Streptomyces kasugaensis TaxID=1946 RepID=A0A4Q9HJS6_STRKA|nr:amidohydrolase [Streptomyces kasugaensis]